MSSFLRQRPGRGKSEVGVLGSEKARKIVHDYAAVLEHSAPAFGCVADARELPHSKRLIKHAIVVCLSHATCSVNQEALEAGYVALADWQEDVGHSHIRMPLFSADLCRSPEELDRRLAVQEPEEADKWIATVISEMSTLHEEIKTRVR